MTPQHNVVAVAGDWHGNTRWAQARIQQAAAHGIRLILHVGDWGLWPGPSGKQYRLVIEDLCTKHGITMLVTPGNHEDWDRIDAKTAVDRGDGWGAIKWLSGDSPVGFLPRGHRFHIEGAAAVVRSFVSLGGAPSIDYERRIPGKSWWPTEAITPEDVEATIGGGYADVMLTHDAPDGGTDQVADILGSNPFGWSEKALAYAAYGRELMTEAFHGVAPGMLIHGHFHVFGEKQVRVPRNGEIAESRVVALHQDGMYGNVIYLDVASLTYDTDPKQIGLTAAAAIR